MSTSVTDQANHFQASFASQAESGYWEQAGSAFRVFWKNKVLNDDIQSFEGSEVEDLDPIIRLLDSQGKKASYIIRTALRILPLLGAPSARFSLTQMIVVSIHGMLFGVVFAKTRSLLPPFLLHAVNNFVAFIGWS
jgi:hypothetical protein